MHVTSRTLIAGALGVGSLSLAGAGVSVAATSGSTSHSFTVISKVTTEKDLPGNHFIDANNDTIGGTYVGSDVVSGHFDASTGTVTAHVALALNGGLIYARFTADGSTGDVAGKILGGSGKFYGVSGTVTGSPVSNSATKVTVTYRR